jgi:dipeptidyl aminopeptidase/acylaminoacyl peptidase
VLWIHGGPEGQDAFTCGGELDDVVAGVSYLVDKGLADRTRIGIGGGSHGGTMVAYAVTRQPDLSRPRSSCTASSIARRITSVRKYGQSITATDDIVLK